MEIKDGGILLSLKNGTRDTQQVVAGKFLSNLRAELEALKITAEMLLTETNSDKLTALFTDAKSVISVLMNKMVQS